MSDVYKVSIARLSDGKTRVISQKIVPGDTRESVSFYWGEGNAACDCNRDIFFRHAGGETPSDHVVPCGDSLYSAQIVDFGDMPEE